MNMTMRFTCIATAILAIAAIATSCEKTNPEEGNPGEGQTEEPAILETPALSVENQTATSFNVTWEAGRRKCRFLHLYNKRWRRAEDIRDINQLLIRSIGREIHSKGKSHFRE